MTCCLVGVISDTHGLLRPEAIRALENCSRIIHAGDVGTSGLLDQLRQLAPTTAVRGNVDRGDWAQSLPIHETVSLGGVTVHVIHDLRDFVFRPAMARVRVVISGHSHQPQIEEREGMLYLNPGAAGPRRFKLPVTVAHLEIHPGGQISTRLIDLMNPAG